MKQILNAQNVCFSYYKKPLCLKDVNLSLNEKEKVVLFAPEEMGKTTFLKVMASFEDKYFGKILYRGKDLKSLSDKEKNFSLIFAEPVFLKGTIRKNIDFLTDTLSIEKIDTLKIAELLKSFKIEADEQTKLKKLSQIDKVKLSLLRSYIKQPDILFVDDIFEQFEKEQAVSLFNTLKTSFKDTTLIFACGEHTSKMLKKEIAEFKFDKALYLNVANYYEFKSVEQFLDSKTDFISLAFKEDWQSDLAVITKSGSDYYLSFENNNRFKLDKIFNGKLDELKLESDDTEDIYFVSPIDFDILSLKNDEINKSLQNGKFSIFMALDGSRVL